MAQLYYGEDIRNGRLVAAKVLLPYLRTGREFVERLCREAEHAAKLQHPNIVPIYDTGVKPDAGQYIVMGWASGGSLADWLDRVQGSLAPGQACSILKPTGAALDYATGGGWCTGTSSHPISC